MNAIFHYDSYIEDIYFISMYREDSSWIKTDNTQVTKSSLSA